MKENLKISIITVCYNAAPTIEATIKSVLSQSYDNIEYIIIDGGSTDGTRNIIEKYKDKISKYVSEKDDGLYDAMNKGIGLSSGEYILFMNSGDLFFRNDTVEKVFSTPHILNYDVIFGDSIATDSNGNKFFKYADPFPNQIENGPTYRHGASFVKSTLQKRYPFDLKKKDTIGFALDYDCIYTLYKNKAKFIKVDIIILDYEEDGVSNNLVGSWENNYKIHNPSYNVIKYSLFRIWIRLKSLLYKSRLIRNIYYFLIYIMNYVIANCPNWYLRRLYYKIMGVNIGEGSVMNMKQYIMTPRYLSIGAHTHINRDCIIDARGYCKIGNNVSISYRVSILSGSHDINSENFNGRYLPIIIHDNVWIGAHAVILQNITLGEGAVVAAGSVVTKNVEPFTIVGGIPARVIGKRTRDLNYKCEWVIPFT